MRSWQSFTNKFPMYNMSVCITIKCIGDWQPETFGFSIFSFSGMCEHGSWWTAQATRGIRLFLICKFDNPIKFYENCGECVLIWEENCLKMINNRDSTMAALLFAIVLVFFVCHAPKAVINIYEVKIYLTSSHTCIILSVFDNTGF